MWFNKNIIKKLFTKKNHELVECENYIKIYFSY